MLAQYILQICFANVLVPFTRSMKLMMGCKVARSACIASCSQVLKHIMSRLIVMMQCPFLLFCVLSGSWASSCNIATLPLVIRLVSLA